MQRLKTRAQFEAAMAGGTVSRTAHFVLHRAPLDASSPSPHVIPAEGAHRHPREGGDPELPNPDALDSRLRGNDVAIGAVVPKRWAKRAVTRNGIKRQIYTVSLAFESRLPAAAHVVRLRTDFARKQFPSAWSDALKAAVRGELVQLFERAQSVVTAQSAIPASAPASPAPSPVIPAKAGTTEPAPAKAGGSQK